MKIIKLDAIDSTNDYLSKLSKENLVDNYTVVVADYQSSGKGQYTNNWYSEKGKNLLFSTLIKFKSFKTTNKTYLNFAISLAIHLVLSKYLDKMKIKWPNDIMADGKKLCGILIENSIKGEYIDHSIIGIGLNVNQQGFPEELQKVTSLTQELGVVFDRDNLLVDLINAIERFITKLENKEYEELYSLYITNLYRINTPSMFINSSEELFMGKIVDVSKEGKLVVELTNESIQQFDVKEIRFAR